MSEEPYERDFDAIEAAVMETPRGRWFLAEFAKRNRVAETRVLLDAVSRLEQGLAGHTANGEAERIRAELAGIVEAIDRAKVEATAPHASSDESVEGFAETAELLSKLARNAETATADIHAATERVQEIAWTLRERGADPAICAELDKRAAAIHTACAFQDLTRQRAGKLLTALGFAEGRLRATTGAPGGATAPAQAPGRGVPDEPATALARFALSPSSSERADPQPLPAYAPLVTEGPRIGSAAPTPRSGATRLGSTRDAAERVYPQTLAALDRLDIREKLKLFT